MTREAQILEHLPQVRLIANSTLRRLPRNSVPFDDLFSAGTIGLIAAVDHYQPERGHSLKTYAEWKIRGAILDSLRGLDPQPRSDRRFARDLAAAVETLEQNSTNTAPDEAEIAAALGLDLVSYQRRRRDAVCVQLPIEYRNADGQPFEAILIAPAEANDPHAAAEQAERAQWLAERIARLPARHRTILKLRYWHGLTLRAIGQRLGVTEGRVSQMHTRAIERLRLAPGARQLAA